MADSNLRSKHGFGVLENIESAKSSGDLDAFDVLYVTDANGTAHVGWIDKNGNTIMVDTEKVIVVEESQLPESGISGKLYIFEENVYFWNGMKFVNVCKPTDVSQLEEQIEKVKTDANSYTDSKIEEAISQSGGVPVVEF